MVIVQNYLKNLRLLFAQQDTMLNPNIMIFILFINIHFSEANDKENRFVGMNWFDWNNWQFVLCMSK